MHGLHDHINLTYFEHQSTFVINAVIVRTYRRPISNQKSDRSGQEHIEEAAVVLTTQTSMHYATQGHTLQKIPYLIYYGRS